MIERNFGKLANFEALSFAPEEKEGPDYPGQYAHEGLGRWERFLDRYGPRLLTAARVVVVLGMTGLAIDALDGRIDGKLDLFPKRAEAAELPTKPVVQEADRIFLEHLQDRYPDGLVGGLNFPEFPGVNPWSRDDTSPVGQRVDVSQIQWCAAWWNKPASERPSCDADQSGGVITTLDLYANAAYWGREWSPEVWFNCTGLEKLDTDFDVKDLRWLANQLLLQEGERNLRGDVGKLDDEGLVIGHDSRVNIVDLVVMLDAFPAEIRREAIRDLPGTIRLELETIRLPDTIRLELEKSDPAK